jgi:hypothetical protein
VKHSSTKGMRALTRSDLPTILMKKQTVHFITQYILLHQTSIRRRCSYHRSSFTMVSPPLWLQQTECHISNIQSYASSFPIILIRRNSNIVTHVRILQDIPYLLKLFTTSNVLRYPNYILHSFIAPRYEAGS